jgi:asparagine N-glycosylation enzyme membrane subunit Stt3
VAPIRAGRWTVNEKQAIWLSSLLAVGLWLAFHALTWALGATPAAEGRFMDTDSYMRLVRVTRLYQTGAWFDGAIPRGNAPYGMALHWTRSFDVLLLAGTFPLAPLLGFERALALVATWISPALHLVTLFALLWAVAPLFGIWRRLLAVAALFVQIGVPAYALAGRADHHMLILLVFVVALGFNLRLLIRPLDVRLALAAGAMLGVGLWISVEFLVLLAATFAALAASWLLRAGDRARRNLWHALALAATVVLAIVLEHPPSDYLTDVYDRISVVHLLIALLALGFWGAVLRFEGRGAALRGRWGRAALAAAGAVLAGGLLFAVYPKFFSGPTVDVDPRLDVTVLASIKELQPLMPHDTASFGRFLLYLGPALVALPWLAALLLRNRRAALRDAWLYVALCTGLFLPLALAMLRFAPYAQVLITIALAEALGLLLTGLSRISLPGFRLIARAGTCLCVLLGFLFLGSSLLQAGPKPRRASCTLDGAVEALVGPEGWGSRPRIILAHFNYGPELLYRTPHAVIAAPYYSNSGGLLDSDRILRSRDGDLSRRLMDRRGVDLILLCRDEAGPEAAFGAQTFLGGLLRGRVPSWLRRVDLPEGRAGNIALYEVLP